MSPYVKRPSPGCHTAAKDSVEGALEVVVVLVALLVLGLVEMLDVSSTRSGMYPKSALERSLNDISSSEGMSKLRPLR